MYLFIMLAVFSFISCQEQEVDIEGPVSLTKELEKIETIYSEGDTKIENKNFGEKIETEASPLLRKIIENELLESYTKQKTYSRASGISFVGVFKDLTCAGNEELRIHMDCEDNRPASKTIDWTGDSYADSDKNIIFKFCIVPNNFTKTNYDFAVLNLTSNVPNSTVRIDRSF